MEDFGIIYILYCHCKAIFLSFLFVEKNSFLRRISASLIFPLGIANLVFFHQIQLLCSTSHAIMFYFINQQDFLGQPAPDQHLTSLDSHKLMFSAECLQQGPSRGARALVSCTHAVVQRTCRVTRYRPLHWPRVFVLSVIIRPTNDSAIFKQTNITSSLAVSFPLPHPSRACMLNSCSCNSPSFCFLFILTALLHQSLYHHSRSHFIVLIL